MRHGHGDFSLRVISPKSGLLLLTYAPTSASATVTAKLVIAMPYAKY